MRRHATLLFLILAAPLLAEERPETPPPAKSPVSPAESLKHLQLAPGLRIDLVAAEPQVVDPIAVRFDEHGGMWVVEMRDYPNGPAAGQPPLSQIRYLQDKDGDGRFESSQVFADKLLFATGLQPWRGGVIVTMAGAVKFMKDNDGDGRADKVEVWYQGFAEDNPQLRANHPTLGLDNYVYVANGLRGGSVIDAREKSAKPVSISGRDFRFHPLTGRYEAVSGVGQFGLTFDDFGNRFVCSNRNPLKHIVLPNRYLSRNQGAAIPAIAEDVATPGAESRIFPISRAWTTSTLHAGQFTAACGVTIYRGDLLPDAFRGNGFTCDPTGNLVHREVLTPSGASFRSRAARQGVEFLASTDEWFRPVNMEVGPDGALYVVDMYRAVIEHPQWVPAELKNRRDERFGDDRGRIYRIARERAAPAKLPRPATASDVELIAELGHNNAWRAETAARLLYQRQAKGLQTQLKDAAARGATAATRVRALRLLQGLDQLDLPTVVAALADDHPRVREQAIVLSEPWLKESAVRRRVQQLSADSDDRVRFQVALSLTPAESDADLLALAEIAIAGAGDVWSRRAVKLACGPRAAQLALAVLRQLSAEGDAATKRELLRDVIGGATAQATKAQRQQLLAEIAALRLGKQDARARFVALNALSSSRARLYAILADLSDDGARKKIAATIDDAKRIAMEAGAEQPVRLDAIDLLAQVKGGEIPLAKLALDGESQALRLRAISALSGGPMREPWVALLAKFSSESPAIRRGILDGALARSDRISLLLDAMERQQIKPAEIDRVRTNRMLKIKDSKLQQRINKLLADAIPADRKQVLADYQPVLKMKADPKRGELVFRKNCATCHRIGDIGVDVAPDIADSRTRQPAQLLTDILQPNRAIDSNYINYTVITADGRSLSGVLASESAAGVTLKQPEGKTVTLPRNEIDEIRSTGVSLMPEGLEKNIPRQQMADLISFIKNWRYLDGKTPLRAQVGK